LKLESQKAEMYLVDHENTGPLIEEFQTAISSADKLCDVIDDETTPFASKYKARTLLDQINSKLEATRTIAMLEKKKNLIEAMDCRMASVRVRLGIISWECEEPHNAQTDLELACEFYFPTLIQTINTLTSDKDNASDNEPVDANAIIELKPPENLLQLPKSESYTLLELAADGMKVLNILGILWAGRSQIHKSFYFLLSANKFFLSTIVRKNEPGAKKSAVDDLENIYTHNCFYLAQAYGNIGHSKLSSKYCHLTLQRQFQFNLQPFFKEYGTSSNGTKPASELNSKNVLEFVNKLKLALDWVKNCGGMSVFYMAMKHYKNCALALSSAENMLRQIVMPCLKNVDSRLPTSLRESSATMLNNLKSTSEEMEADLHRRFVSLDVLILKAASSAHKEKILAAEMGIPYVPTEETEDNEELPSKQSVADSSVFKFGTSSSSGSKESSEVEFFTGIPVTPITFLSANDIDSFEKARTVFLRAATRIEVAKKHYVIDGFVTDHSTLLQEHSQLYHYLSLFETETKRKLAMESRRIEMLSPLLHQLNKASYEVLHKQISYELGESALAMLEIKLDKFRSRESSGEIDFKKLKVAEKTKCNEYSKTALVMFAHFTYMYCQAKDRISTKTSQHFETLPLYQLSDCCCMDPDEGLISEDEIRPFLNAHFLSCRVLSKIIPSKNDLPPDGPKAHYIMACLRRYTWLVEIAPRLCKRYNVEVSTLFGDEIKICQDLVKLLPAKIDRMNYLGEGGLSL